MSIILQAVTLFLPWRIRRLILSNFLGYEIHPTAKIGFSLALTKRLIMKKDSYIGSLNIIKGLDELYIAENSTIGNLNWITSFPSKTTSKHFSEQIHRTPSLIIGEHSAITNRHLIDCTETVRIGKFSTFAGFRSQILTHSIDIFKNKQIAKPVIIGDYCFVGTGCIFLGGSKLPDNSVLGAGAVLNKAYEAPFYLYAGTPAKPLKELPPGALYFTRKSGYVI